MGNWYVYIHLRKDSNRPFYVGIGCRKNHARAFSHSARNQHWKNIVKSNGFDVEIIEEGLCREDAIKKEKELISFYGRDCDGGILCNLTIGGDGASGYVFTDEHKSKLRDRALNMTPEHKIKLSERKMGHTGAFLNKKHTHDSRLKISESLKGIKRSEETKQKVRVANLGKKYSEETNLKKGRPISEERKKQISIKLKGIVRSEETRRKMSESRKQYFRNKDLLWEGK